MVVTKQIAESLNIKKESCVVIEALTEIDLNFQQALHDRDYG